MGKTERIGVSKVQLIVNEELEWIFREQKEEDYGIDALIEVRGKEYPTGKLLGVQIKSGESYFSERKNDEIIYRFDTKHYNYWINYSTQVILVLYSLSTKKCIWGVIDKSSVIKTNNGRYKIGIKKANYLSKDSKNRLLMIAYNNNIEELAYAVAELFATPQEVRSLYLELDDEQKKIFKRGLSEFQEKNMTYHGMPLEINDESLKIIEQVIQEINSDKNLNIKYLEENEKIIPDFIECGFDRAYICVKQFLSQSNEKCLIILGVTGMGKTTLARKIQSEIGSKGILILGREFCTQLDPINCKVINSDVEIIIFDGWDEVMLAYRELAQRFINDIIENKKYKIIITSRYSLDFINDKKRILKMDSLTNEQIYKILQNRVRFNSESNKEIILRNMSLFNTPLLLQLAIQISKSYNILLEDLTIENIISTIYLNYPEERKDVLKKISFDMFVERNICRKINSNQEEIQFKQYKELLVKNGNVSFIHANICDFFLAGKIYEDLFVNIEKFESNCIDLFAFGIPSIQTFDYIKILINKNGMSNKKIRMLSEKFEKMLEKGVFGRELEGTSFFEVVANVFYCIWHLMLYINKHFNIAYKINISNNIEKNLTCLIDIFNRCYCGKKYLDFSGMNLEELRLWRCNAIDINFNNCKLKYANFRWGCLTGSSFENADMTGCQLVGANMQKCNFKNVILNEANVAHCIISESSLEHFLKYENTLNGFKSLIIYMGRGEYMNYSLYKDIENKLE